MAEPKPKPELVITPEHTAIYVNFEHARAFQKDGKDAGDPKYGYTALFDASATEEMKPMYAAAAKVAKAKWPDIQPDELQTILKRTFKNGDREADRLKARRNNPRPEEKVKLFRGKVIVKATSKSPIDVSEPGAGGKPVEIINWKKVYAGMRGKAEFNFVAYDNSFGDDDTTGARGFVSVYVNFFLKTGEGERIGGRDRNSVWSGVQGAQSNEKPKGLDDDIPF